MSLPGSSSIPAVYRERGSCAYATGRRIVDLVLQDVKPSDIMTREAFENAIAVNTAIGGSTNAPIHLNAMAKHMGVPLNNADWEKVGHSLPLLVNIQPAGKYLCEEYHRAGGLPGESTFRAIVIPTDVHSCRCRASRSQPPPPSFCLDRIWQIDRRQLPWRPAQRSSSHSSGFQTAQDRSWIPQSLR